MKPAPLAVSREPTNPELFRTALVSNLSYLKTLTLTASLVVFSLLRFEKFEVS